MFTYTAKNAFLKFKSTSEAILKFRFMKCNVCIPQELTH